MSKPLGRWNSKKAYQVAGGGIMSSLPPSTPTASTGVDEQSAGGGEGGGEESSSHSSIQFIESTTLSNGSIAGGSIKRPQASDEAPGPKLKKSKPATKKKGATTGKGKGRGVEIVPTLPWPEEFRDLEKIFKALNTVYTFCSSRKSIVITFDLLKTSVENLLKKKLEINSIAQIKSLLPELITFAYVDPELLRLHSDKSTLAKDGMISGSLAGGTEGGGGGDGGTLGDSGKPKGKLGGRAAKRKELDDAYEFVSSRPPVASTSTSTSTSLSGGFDAVDETMESSVEGREKREDRVVLQFTFNDGELKSANGVGKVMNRRKYKWKKPLKPPSPTDTTDPTSIPLPLPSKKPPTGTQAKYTTKSMTDLIAKRNQKFTDAINELLLACASHEPSLDPIELLREATEDHLPVLPGIVDGVDGDAEGEGGGRGRKKGRKERKEEMEFFERFPSERLSVERILEDLAEEEWWKDQIVPGGRKTVPAREAQFGELDIPLSAPLAGALYSTSGISSLYDHQAKAINILNSHLLPPSHPAFAPASITQLSDPPTQSAEETIISPPTNRKSIIISTSTSSGKSLIYQIPILQSIERDPTSTALFIFPTKALAQDQMRGLGTLLINYGKAAMDWSSTGSPMKSQRRGEDGEEEGMGEVRVATFDGDTPMVDRDYIRENASVIFTNPDMLHLTILPQEERWRRFFAGLRFVVVDELHYYTGAFGSHVALVIRRLRRICAAIGNRHVQFISCSATISNPIEHMEKLMGLTGVELIDVDGSPTGKKEQLIWNPPMIDEMDWKQGRVSTITEASRLFRFLLERGARVIVFCKVRIMCEIMMKQVRTDLLLEGQDDMAQRIMSYRSGYSAVQRREIEQEMFSGKLLGVIATTALELGIDIGSLDAVITVGFPYTLSGLRQQSGRAGRRKQDSLSVLICDPFPLDQHYARNPSLIYDSSLQRITLDLENPIILEAHVQVAADELPISLKDDIAYFGEGLRKICAGGKLVEDGEWYHCHPSLKPNPARTVSIRSTEEVSYSIIDVSPMREGGAPKNKVIEEIELSRAIFTIYEGAVFHQQGFTFLVGEVDHERKLAKVRECVVHYSTRQRDFTNIDAKEALSTRAIEGSDCIVSYGVVEITSVVFGYFKADRRGNILDVVDISSPPFIRSSHGLWIDVPQSALQILVEKNIEVAASIHAAEHAVMSLTPVVAMCAEGDIKTECKNSEKELASTPSSRKRPARIVLYDAAGMSSGICAKAFDHITMLLTNAAHTISSCKCNDGCPSCVASPTCSGANTIVSKLGALIVLQSILNQEIDIDAIPQQQSAYGVVPGGSIDMRGISRRPTTAIAMREKIMEVAMEEEELTAEQEEERERVLRELMRG